MIAEIVLVLVGVGNIAAACRLEHLFADERPSFARALAHELCILAPMTSGVLLIAFPLLGRLGAVLP